MAKIIQQWVAVNDDYVYRVVDDEHAERLTGLVQTIYTPEEFATFLRTRGAFTVSKVPGSAVR